MQYVMTAVPLLIFAGIIALIVAPVLRRRFARARPVRRAPRAKPLLRVSRDQMDDDLQDLIRRRS